MRIVVVGTGTDVGKTHVACALLARLASGAVRTVAYKPVASGVAPHCEDTRRHAEALGALEVPATFAYLRPVSPHVAAREEGRAVDLDVVVREAARLEHETQARVSLVEAAGGLFSPLSERTTNADLVRALAPARVLLVAPDRLGVLHDLHATLTAARAESIPVHAVVLSAPEHADASTGDNAAEVGRTRLATLAPSGRVIARFPREDYRAEASSRAAEDAIRALLATPGG